MIYSSHMETVDAIILGVVQGITEFLPVSSTGHLVLFRDWLTLDPMYGLAFDAVLHFATTLAIIIYFWSDLWNLLQVGLRKLSRLPVNTKDITLLYALILGTIPAAFIGFFSISIIETYLDSTFTVAIFLVTGSALFMYTEWKYYNNPSHQELTVKKGILIGFFQVLALLPGMSRSGATIAGGMLLGLSRYESSRFSFLLSIPITLGAGLHMTLELMKSDTTVNWIHISIGAVIAFFSALIVIHFFLKFIRKYTLWPFIWYGIVLAGLVIYVHWFV